MARQISLCDQCTFVILVTYHILYNCMTCLIVQNEEFSSARATEELHVTELLLELSQLSANHFHHPEGKFQSY